MQRTRRPAASDALRAKADPPLLRALESLQFDPTVELPVIVVLAQSEPSQDTSAIQDRRAAAEVGAAAFDLEAARVLDELRRAGATEIRPNWISRSLAMRGHLPVLEVAAERPEVRQIVLDTRRHALT